MLTVVVDTNAVHRDPWLTRDDAPKLVQLAASGVCEVVYPRVVIAELTRQRVESARDAHDAAAAGVKQMGVAGVDVAETVALLQGAHDRTETEIDDAFTAVLTKDGIREIPVPEVETTDLLERDLGRRRPFLEIEQGKTKKSLGFRDVLIWESVLGVVQGPTAGDTVFFVTFDAGFLADDKKSLHLDLLEDLDRLGIPRGRVRLARGSLKRSRWSRISCPSYSLSPRTTRPNKRLLRRFPMRHSPENPHLRQRRLRRTRRSFPQQKTPTRQHPRRDPSTSP